jgi:hypothetical protein
MTIHRAISYAGLATIVLTAGCSSRSSVVKGIVTLDGKPIVGGAEMYGTVTFYHSDGSGAPAVGIIDESGRYLLKTGTEGQLPPGDYLVSIAVKQITKPTTLDGMPQAHLITHAKYADVNESGFKATVRPGTHTFDFALTSGGPSKTNRAQ